MFSPAIVLASLLVFQAEASAPPPSSEDEAVQLEDVIVDGRRVNRRVASFLDQVVEAPSGRGPARWRDNICIGVANIQREAAQFMVDRISDIAFDLGLSPGEPGCQANVLIIGSSDGADLARSLVTAKPNTFWPGGSGMNLSRAALAAFQTGEAPVRWWHVSAPVDANTGQLATRLPGEDAPTISRTTSGRLRTQIRNDLNRVIVIVDVPRSEGLNFTQLSDYVAMAAFSQVDPDADASNYDSVLNLFRDPAGVEGLTAWDRAYLTALYSAELNQSASSHQLGEIGRLMQQTRTRSESD